MALLVLFSVCPSSCTSCYITPAGEIKCAVCASRFTLNLAEDGCTACPDNCHRCYIDEDDSLVKCFDQDCETGYALRETSSGVSVFDCQGNTHTPHITHIGTLLCLHAEYYKVVIMFSKIILYCSFCFQLVTQVAMTVYGTMIMMIHLCVS